MSINTIANQKKLKEFSLDIISKLQQNPLITLTADDITKSLYPDEKCQFCRQYGCNQKFNSFYMHKECFDFVNKETKKFMKDVLKLPTK